MPLLRRQYWSLLVIFATHGVKMYRHTLMPAIVAAVTMLPRILDAAPEWRRATRLCDNHLLSTPINYITLPGIIIVNLPVTMLRHTARANTASPASQSVVIAHHQNCLPLPSRRHHNTIDGEDRRSLRWLIRHQHGQRCRWVIVGAYTFTSCLPYAMVAALQSYWSARR